MKSLIVGGIALSSLALVGSAFAADLPSHREAPAPAPYFAPASVYNWTGFYVGVNGGLATGSFTKQGKSDFGNANAGAFGATIGYNYQFSQFVLGAEADYDFMNFNANKTFAPGVSGKGTVNSLGTVRGRFGYAIDRALIYGTGGYAFGNVKTQINDTVTPFSGSSSALRSGYALGAGIEYAFTNNISAKGEYLFTSLAAKNNFVGTADPVKSGANISNIRFGLNYKF